MRKADEKLLDAMPKYSVIKKLLELEAQNSLKNTVLNEIREDYHKCYTNDLTLRQERIEFMMKRIDRHIDGVCQTASDIADINWDCKVLTDYLEESIPN